MLAGMRGGKHKWRIARSRFPGVDEHLWQGSGDSGYASVDGLHRAHAEARDCQDPDGDYVAEGFLDDDGRNRGVTLPIKVTVRVRGDDVEVDLTGPSPQVPTAFNVPFDGSTKVACYFAFRALLLDTYTHAEYIPQNEGSFRPVKVTALLGCIFNPIAPAAAEARFSQIQRVVDLIIKTMAPVVPDKCTAGNAAVLSFASYSGVRPNGDYWVFLEVNEAAMGRARCRTDQTRSRN